MRQGNTFDAGPSDVGPSGAGPFGVGTLDAGIFAFAGPSGVSPFGVSGPSYQLTMTPRRRRISQGTSICRRPREWRMSFVYKRQPKVSHLLFFFCFPKWAG
jgi:hypothetical protein